MLVNHNIKWIYTCSIEGYEPEYIFKSKAILTKKEKKMSGLSKFEKNVSSMTEMLVGKKMAAMMMSSSKKMLGIKSIRRRRRKRSAK